MIAIGPARQYLEGLDWAGRQVRRDKRGKIPDDAPPVLAELGLTGASLIGNIENFETKYRHAIGSEKSLAEFDEKRKQRRAQRARSGSKSDD